MTKPTNLSVRPAKTRISLGIGPVWSESSLSAQGNIGSLATHWAHSEDWSGWADVQADPSLRVAHIILLILSCCRSFDSTMYRNEISGRIRGWCNQDFYVVRVLYSEMLPETSEFHIDFSIECFTHNYWIKWSKPCLPPWKYIIVEGLEINGANPIKLVQDNLWSPIWLEPLDHRQTEGNWYFVLDKKLMFCAW